jgi:transcriptional regulator with XRE-family HTH domain
MPTDEEIALRRRRRAWWIASARRADPRQPTLEEVALAVKLKAKSASTISDWEKGIGGGPSLVQLERLAAFYGLPVSTFTEPQPTEQEFLEGLRELALAAIELEQQDATAEAAAGPPAAGAPPAPLRRRSA